MLGHACIGTCIADSSARWAAEEQSAATTEGISAALFSGCSLFLKGLVLLVLWAGMTSLCFKPEKIYFHFSYNSEATQIEGLEIGASPWVSGHEMRLHTCGLLPLPPAAQLSRMGLGSRLPLASPLEGRDLGEPWDCTWWVNSYHWCCYASMLRLFAVSMFPKIH